jgi:hypothetical protein
MDETKKVLGGGNLSTARDIDGLYCFDSNNCYQDFNFSGVPDASVDPIVTAVEECLPLLLDPFPKVMLGNFGNCFLSALNRASDQPGIFPEETATNTTVDTCLIENDCIVFASGGGLDHDLVASCTSNVTLCGSYLSSEQASSCLAGCDGLLCVTGCFGQHTQLSPIVNTLTGCLNALLDPSFEGSIEACRVPDSTNDPVYSSTIAGGLVKGLPRLVTCVQGMCSSAASPILGILNLDSLHCMTSCFGNSTSSFDGLFCLFPCFFT